MIAEIFPALYDIHGRRTFNPGTRGRRIGFHPDSMGRYLTYSIKTQCKDFEEMRSFLFTCRARRRKDIQKRDYWQAPQEFQRTRVGNCVDFSLWAWRQVLAMGYTARFVVGKAGKFGAGHAWVTFERDGSWFLLEPQLRHLGMRMPRISTLRYHPNFPLPGSAERFNTSSTRIATLTRLCVKCPVS